MSIMKAEKINNLLIMFPINFLGKNHRGGNLERLT
jgi:hypothetical protein